jgi:hypothetical protein
MIPCRRQDPLRPPIQHQHRPRHQQPARATQLKSHSLRPASSTGHSVLGRNGHPVRSSPTPMSSSTHPALQRAHLYWQGLRCGGDRVQRRFVFRWHTDDLPRSHPGGCPALAAGRQLDHYTSATTAEAGQSSGEPDYGSGVAFDNSNQDEGVGTLRESDLRAGRINHMLRINCRTICSSQCRPIPANSRPARGTRRRKMVSARLPTPVRCHTA